MIAPIALITLAAAAAGYGIGTITRRNLSRLGYRRGDERDLPAPPPRRWVPWATAAAAATISAVAAVSAQPIRYLPLVPLAMVGPWLAAVDVDVQRLPNRVNGVLAGAVAVGVVLVAVGSGELSVAVYAALGGILAGAVYLITHSLTRGGIGMGDVKLAAVAGLALGATGLTPVLAAILFGSVGAIVWTKVSHHHGFVAYGPWLLLGTWAATVLTAVLA